MDKKPLSCERISEEGCLSPLDLRILFWEFNSLVCVPEENVGHMFHHYYLVVRGPVNFFVLLLFKAVILTDLTDSLSVQVFYFISFRPGVKILVCLKMVNVLPWVNPPCV